MRTLCAAGALLALGTVIVVASACSAEAEKPAQPHRELAELFRQDQRDRQPKEATIDWSAVAPRDARRRARVRQLLGKGAAQIAADYYHAAVVFQHGSTPDDYEVAHELALRVTELDPSHPHARGLAAAAKDRYLLSTGQPQRYGTQPDKLDGRSRVPPAAPATQRQASTELQ